jgi:hypothetical protein
VPASTSTSAFSEARSKLNPQVLIRATKEVAARGGAQVPGGDRTFPCLRGERLNGVIYTRSRVRVMARPGHPRTGSVDGGM